MLGIKVRNAAHSMQAILVLTLIGCASIGGVGRDLDKLSSGLLVEEQDQGRALPPAGLQIRPVHPKGLELTKLSEGWVPHLYNDAADYCTIGYGHLIKKARCNGNEPAEFLPGISKERGTELLKDDMAGAQIIVMTSVKVPITDVQYSALTDFVFNVGGTNFKSSTLLKRINANDFGQVPNQLRRWVKAGGKTFPGLATRREREIALFFDGQSTPKDLPQANDDLSVLDVHTGEQ